MGDVAAWEACGCAPDVDLMSNQPEERRCDRLLLRGCMIEKMENFRVPRRIGLPDLTALHWGCEGGKLVTVGVSICVKDV